MLAEVTKRSIQETDDNDNDDNDGDNDCDDGDDDCDGYGYEDDFDGHMKGKMKLYVK